MNTDRLSPFSRYSTWLCGLYVLGMILVTPGLVPVTEFPDSPDSRLRVQIPYRDIFIATLLIGFSIVLISTKLTRARYFIARSGYALISLLLLICYLYRELDVDIWYDVKTPDAVFVVLYALLFPWLGLSPSLPHVTSRILLLISLVLPGVYLLGLITFIADGYPMHASDYYGFAAAIFYYGLSLHLYRLKRRIYPEPVDINGRQIAISTSALIGITLVVTCLVSLSLEHITESESWLEEVRKRGLRLSAWNISDIQTHFLVLSGMLLLTLLAPASGLLPTMKRTIRGFCIWTIPLLITLIVVGFLILSAQFLHDFVVIHYLISSYELLLSACQFFPPAGLLIGLIADGIASIRK